MKRLLIICLSAALVSLAGCSDDEDIQPAQKEKIVSFLTGTHAPRLVAEENLEEGSNQPYYTVSGDAVYRYITDIYNPDRVNWPEVTPTSTVKITFRAYVFTYANIVTTGSENNWTVPYYTNDASLKSFLEGRGLNTEWWTFEPLTVDMRHPGIIKRDGRCVTWLPRGRCRRGVYDIQYGLWRRLFRHYPEGESHSLAFYGGCSGSGRTRPCGIRQIKC